MPDFQVLLRDQRLEVADPRKHRIGIDVRISRREMFVGGNSSFRSWDVETRPTEPSAGAFQEWGEQPQRIHQAQPSSTFEPTTRLGSVEWKHFIAGEESAFSRLRDQGEFDETRVVWRMVNPLDSSPVLSRLGKKDVGYEGLRVSVVEREPARLDLRHDPVAWPEDVIRRGQGKAVQEWRIGRDGFGVLEALAIATAKNIGRDH